jgi:DNA-binding transcriptional regulator GbsR (MarR family)
LEAMQIVSKEKTGAFEKGKPRNLFSISKDFFYITILTRDFSEKKLLSLTDYQKSIIKVWSLEDLELKQFLEETKKNRFQYFLDNREEPQIMDGILDRIIEILYNEKGVVTTKLK